MLEVEESTLALLFYPIYCPKVVKLPTVLSGVKATYPWNPLIRWRLNIIWIRVRDSVHQGKHKGMECMKKSF